MGIKDPGGFHILLLPYLDIGEDLLKFFRNQNTYRDVFKLLRSSKYSF